MHENVMTNEQWLAWFDAQTREVRAAAMHAIDALEAQGMPGRRAHEVVRHAIAIAQHEHAARIASIPYVVRY